MKTFLSAMCVIALAASVTAAEPAAPPTPAPQAPAPPEPPHLEIDLIEPGSPFAARTNQAWLGVGVEEAAEPLAAQLNLPAGSGLVVTYANPNSPAALAGIQKHDVLTELQSHVLVHPAQLRKLIQSHKPGDEVSLVYFHAGKSNAVRVVLTNAPPGIPDGSFWQELVPDLKRELRPMGEEIRKQMEEVRRSLRESGIDREKLEREIRRGLEEARRGLEEAARASSNAAGAALRQLENRRFELGTNSSVVVRNERRGVKTLVKTDDEGTVTIIADPRRRAIVYDKEGKVMFEGEIETPDQLEKVPEPIRDRLQPLLKQMEKEATAAPASPTPLNSPKEEAKQPPAPARQSSSEPGLSPRYSAVIA